MMADEIVVDEHEESAKERKKREKAEKKALKKAAKGIDAKVTDSGTMYLDAEEDEDEGSLSMALITLFIVLVWLAILALLIKLDVGGFGSGIMTPVFKNVPVINKILPEKDVYVEEEREFKDLNEAVAEVEKLRAENEQLKEELDSSDTSSSEEVATLKEEIKRLKTFEDSQIEFQKLKTEFYEEVVFADQAPDISKYKAYYESIDPDNAEYLYKQVVQQMAKDEELNDYVKAYSEMKPKSAAKVFEEMSGNLDLVAKILDKMDASQRAKILNVMDPEIASRLTKIMDPE
ncbi:MAG: hypothetical protein K5857_00965 [Lachnospiraceae bacterium]|nr:hypothetical protein [Lachnospiraceae bacterium]